MEVPKGEMRGFPSEVLPILFEGESPIVSRIDNVNVRFADGFKNAFGAPLHTGKILTIHSESPSGEKLEFCTSSF